MNGHIRKHLLSGDRESGGRTVRAEHDGDTEHGWYPLSCGLRQEHATRPAVFVGRQGHSNAMAQGASQDIEWEEGLR